MNKKKTIKKLIRTLAITLTAGISLQASVTSDDHLEESDWRQAVSENSLDAYERYLALHPVGRHAGEAFRLAILAQTAPASGGDKAMASQQPSSSKWRPLDQVLSRLRSSPLASLSFGSSAYAQNLSALEREEQDWKQACQENTIDSYTWYLELHPEGKYSGAASTCIIDRELCNNVCLAQNIYD